MEKPPQGLVSCFQSEPFGLSTFGNLEGLFRSTLWKHFKAYCIRLVASLQRISSFWVTDHVHMAQSSIQVHNKKMVKTVNEKGGGLSLSMQRENSGKFLLGLERCNYSLLCGSLYVCGMDPWWFLRAESQ